MSGRLLGFGSVVAMAAAMPAQAEMTFNRVASFAVVANMAPGEDVSRVSSAEIVTATADGMTLVYTDSPLGVIGMIDITDPAAPKPLGNLAMGGEPTSATIVGGFAYVGVNTSDTRATPTGRLAVVDLATKAEVATCDLGGQPDSVAKARDGSFIAIAIENERDEDVNDGEIPQMPAGYVVKLPLTDTGADCAALQKIAMTGLADVAGDDPEPEFVDVNGLGEIVVTLQENNHIAVIGADGSITADFSAGTVTLEDVDLSDDGKLSFSETQTDRLREPDAVKWIDDMHFAVANEGDYEGGARGWTVFAKDGSVVYESAASFERAVAAVGHYPDGRSDAKGIELESVEFARFGDTPMVFVAAERASVIGVYDVTDPASPVLAQILPSGISPEGLVAIPGRDLLVSANEVDLVEDGLARSHVMIYQRAEGPAAYPMLTSAGTAPLIGWGAMSGLTADPATPGLLYAVNDSVYRAAPTIYTIDATQVPARITAAMTVTRGGDAAQKLDLEGIAADGEGGFWLASEGRSDRLIPHAIYHVGADGEIDTEIGLPPELLAGETRYGFEGITKVGNVLWMAIQREWGDDPKGQVKLLAYDLDAEEWGAVRYPLDTPTEGAWMGLSEITVAGDWVYLIERDNQVGAAAVTKHLTRVPLAELVAAPLDSELAVVTKETVRDLLPDLAVLNGYAMDKIESFAVDAAGTAFVMTDNDGIDDSSGETLFWNIGTLP